MKRVLVLILLLSVFAGTVLFRRYGPFHKKITKPERNAIPAAFADSLPTECFQVVLVIAENVDRVPAKLWLLERQSSTARWTPVAGPMDASLGKNGVAWGYGDPPLPKPGGYPDKKEGDGRSPAGIFSVPYAFGVNSVAMAGAAGVKLPWQECTETLRGIDDSASRYYNQVVDGSRVTDVDWNSAEIMRREDGLYNWGAAIAHNPSNQSGGGSCIFLHIWRGPGQGTAGCTALAEKDVLTILRWLDPAKSPRLILTVR